MATPSYKLVHESDEIYRYITNKNQFVKLDLCSPQLSDLELGHHLAGIPHRSVAKNLDGTPLICNLQRTLREHQEWLVLHLAQKIR